MKLLKAYLLKEKYGVRKLLKKMSIGKSNIDNRIQQAKKKLYKLSNERINLKEKLHKLKSQSNNSSEIQKKQLELRKLNKTIQKLTNLLNNKYYPLKSKIDPVKKKIALGTATGASILGVGGYATAKVRAIQKKVEKGVNI